MFGGMWRGENPWQQQWNQSYNASQQANAGQSGEQTHQAGAVPSAADTDNAQADVNMQVSKVKVLIYSHDIAVFKI